MSNINTTIKKDKILHLALFYLWMTLLSLLKVMKTPLPPTRRQREVLFQGLQKSKHDHFHTAMGLGNASSSMGGAPFFGLGTRSSRKRLFTRFSTGCNISFCFRGLMTPAAACATNKEKTKAQTAIMHFAILLFLSVWGSFQWNRGHDIQKPISPRGEENSSQVARYARIDAHCATSFCQKDACPV